MPTCGPRSSTAVNDPSCRIRWWGIAAIGQTESRHAAGRTIAVDGTITPPDLRARPRRLRRFRPHRGHRRWATRRRHRVRPRGGTHAVHPLDLAIARVSMPPATGFADPQNIYDAAYSTARYLCASARPLTMDTEAGFMKAAHSYSGSATYPAISWDVVGSVPGDRRRGRLTVGPARTRRSRLGPPIRCTRARSSAELDGSGLVGPDHPHGVELRRAAVGVADRQPGAVDLVVAGRCPGPAWPPRRSGSCPRRRSGWSTARRPSS